MREDSQYIIRGMFRRPCAAVLAALILPSRAHAAAPGYSASRYQVRRGSDARHRRAARRLSSTRRLPRWQRSAAFRFPSTRPTRLKTRRDPRAVHVACRPKSPASAVRGRARAALRPGPRPRRGHPPLSEAAPFAWSKYSARRRRTGSTSIKQIVGARRCKPGALQNYGWDGARSSRSAFTCRARSSSTTRATSTRTNPNQRIAATSSRGNSTWPIGSTAVRSRSKSAWRASRSSPHALPFRRRFLAAVIVLVLLIWWTMSKGKHEPTVTA